MFLRPVSNLASTVIVLRSQTSLIMGFLPEIPGLIFKMKAIKFGKNVGLDMLLSKPASQLIKYVQNDPITHLHIFLWPLMYQSFFSRVSFELSHDDFIKWNYFPLYWPFARGIQGHRWIPLTKASDAELWYFLISAPEQALKQTIEKPVIWDAFALITSL